MTIAKDVAMGIKDMNEGIDFNQRNAGLDAIESDRAALLQRTAEQALEDDGLELKPRSYVIESEADKALERLEGQKLIDDVSSSYGYYMYSLKNDGEGLSGDEALRKMAEMGRAYEEGGAKGLREFLDENPCPDDEKFRASEYGSDFVRKTADTLSNEPGAFPTMMRTVGGMGRAYELGGVDSLGRYCDAVCSDTTMPSDSLAGHSEAFAKDLASATGAAVSSSNDKSLQRSVGGVIGRDSSDMWASLKGDSGKIAEQLGEEVGAGPAQVGLAGRRQIVAPSMSPDITFDHGIVR